MRPAKRRARQSVWGNWNGYLGNKRAFEFGTDQVSAGYWVLTGEYDYYAGYENSALTAKCREATQL